MSGWSGIAVVGVVGLIILRGLTCGTDAYGAFLQGARRGMESALGLLPALCAMLLMLAMIRASGLAELLTRFAAPMTGAAGIPGEIAPMLLLRPLTGSGSIAAMEQIFDSCGVDSRAGRIASVLMGSSETIFYTMTVYLSAAGIRRLPHVMGVSLAAYLTGVLACGWLM